MNNTGVLTMAHERDRHIADIFQKLLQFSPIVGIFGHRQVGKSTFLAGCINNYRTLDDIDELESARRDPKDFIRTTKKPPLAIDECQLEPKLFPTLKEWVRTHKQPCQFVLSGSVRFTSRKAIKESLAGRMAFVEMMPFSVTELLSKPLSDVVLKLFNHKQFSEDSIRCLNQASQLKNLMKHFSNYLENGGLPGLCFVRSPQLQKNALFELHDLILSRDLALVNDLRTPVTTLKKLLSHIATCGFEPYIASDVRRSIGLAPQTQKKILDAMESIFLIRRIPVPLRKKEIILLEDQLEERVYAGPNLNLSKRLETAVFRNIRTQFYYRLDKNIQFETYLTRDNARVPIVIKDGNNTLGIIVHEAEIPSLSEVRSAASFLRNHANAKVIYLSAMTTEPKILDDRSMICSLAAVL
jgi:predicted AAA+ superfamily ATPase